ncbi:hypothetical protein RD792_001463 [Penstemon davidsonii]|uniref:Uncharacterized protein n=1 Tax=Penstemon davidsonii TaxID=160366 RepID=A0ABR0DNG7_9LAMI|nr:hypothetical protein RD792_001463 [Penstemon davidsonii]
MVQMGSWGNMEQGWRKGPWTPEEDKLLFQYVSQNGEGRWSSVSSCAGLKRSGKSCRLRWVNYLRPGLKKGNITPQEEGIIIELHALWGNKWSTIARYLPGRTDNEIKNYWRTHFKKRKATTTPEIKQEKRKIAKPAEEKEETSLQEAEAIEKNSNKETELVDENNQFLPMIRQDSISFWSEFIPVDSYLWNLEEQINGCSYGVGTLLLSATISATKIDSFISSSQRSSLGMCKRCGDLKMIACSRCRGSGLIEEGGPFNLIPIVDESKPKSRSSSCANCQSKGHFSCPECSKLPQI